VTSVSAGAADRPHPTFSLALGGGGARGLAHIAVIEALDDLGVRPHFIAGCSIGAMMAAAYASGISGVDLRKHTEAVLGDRVKTAKLLMARGAGGITSLFDFNPFRAAFIDGDALLDIVLPPGVADDFAALKIPTILIATDFYERSEFIIDAGPLRPAVAASIALPALIAPQIAGARVLMDGGLVNPLPVDHLQDRADISVAVDVTGNTTEDGEGPPSTTEAMYGAVQIMQNAITEAKLKEFPVDVLIKPAVAKFRVLDFFKVRDVLRAAEPLKDELKRKLETAFAEVEKPA
jgi:NTE family protein